MAAEYITRVIRPTPGIQRDITDYDSEHYIDGQWVRFYKGLPRKIGGYKLIDQGNGIIVRTLFSVPQNNNSVDVYIGRFNQVAYFNIDFSLTGGAEIDRTPVGFVSDPNYIWQFDLFTAVDELTHVSTSSIVAVPLRILTDNSDTTENQIYSGDISVSTALTPIGQTTSGGIVNVAPFLFKYGTNGVVSWSAADDLTTWPDANIATIATTKIIKGLSARGSDTPSALFWSLNSLVRAVYNTSTSSFSFTTINDQVSLMSSSSVNQYRGLYYWVGIDQFYFYNGIVQTLPNTQNLHWFFNNLNTNQRSKVWSIIYPKYQEWWIFYPRGDATECTNAIVYNIAGNFWYDTQINRAAGYPSQVFTYPIMSDSFVEFDPSQNPYFGVWAQEVGTDKSAFSLNSAIPSYFETNIITLYDQNPSSNLQFRTRRLEPDFTYTNTDTNLSPEPPPGMTVTVKNRAFPQSIPVSSIPYPFDKTTEKVDMNEMGRLVSFVFESNAGGGFYQMGKPTIDFLPGDVRPGN